MVIFRGADGKAGYHQADALDDAVRFVERVRNDEGVEAAHIFRLQEVPFEFRPYFRVELRPPDGQPEAPATETSPAEAPSSEGAGEPAAEAVDAMPDPVPVPVDPEPASAGGRKGLFAR